MGTETIDIPKGACPRPSEIGSLGAFFKPSVVSEKQLVRADERLIGELLSVLDRQLLKAVDTRSVDEFKSVRDQVMPRYVRGLRALQDTITNLVSDETLEILSAGASVELEQDLEKQRDARFGDKLTDQAVFTLWTVQKIRALGHEIVDAGKVPANKKAVDSDLYYEYRMDSLWAQFHLDVLFTAMRFDRPIDEALKEVICEGLRAAVNAFVIMKDALALRQPARTAPAKTPMPWDKEDEELLASSMRDLNASTAKR